MRVESLRCVGVSAITQTLSRSATGAVKRAVVSPLPGTSTPWVASPKRNPTGALGMTRLAESNTTPRNVATVPPSTVVSGGRI